MAQADHIGSGGGGQVTPKAVIFTADDFGVSREVNAGVVEAHRRGVLTATSLMVGAGARDEAAAAARDNPTLDVGLHLVVCRGTSVLPAGRLAGVVDASGNFTSDPVRGGMRYFFNRRIRTAIRDELRAQIEAHLGLVGSLKHIDGHLNFHVHPVILDLLVELAVEYRVPCMRIPRESVATTLSLARDHAPRKIVESAIFRALSRRARRVITARGIRTSDWLFGLHQSGHLSEEYVLGIIERLRPGLTEIYFHPALDIGGIPPPAEAQREVQILTGAKLGEVIKRAGVRLTSFAEFARS